MNLKPYPIEDDEPECCRYCGKQMGVAMIDHTGWLPICRNHECPSRLEY